MDELNHRIDTFKHFVRKWLRVTAISLVVIGGVAIWNFIPGIDLLPMSFSWALCSGFFLGLWSFIEARKLTVASNASELKVQIEGFHEQHSNRKIIWGIALFLGILTAVFASSLRWSDDFLFLGLGMVGPATIFYLAEFGVGLQIDWIKHALEKKT